jgi:nucleoside-diphosphate-sugar epimerase
MSNPLSLLAVTGASGFVGRAVLALARREGLDVTGLVRSEQGAQAVAALGARARVVARLEEEPLAAALKGAQAVVHLAMIGREREGETYDTVNVRGTRAVVDAAGRAGVPRIVLFSGLGVAHYGLTRRCTNPYFLSKLAAEVELFRLGPEAVVFRPSYIVGPGDGLVRKLLKEMASGEVVRIGDGRYRLQPIAVADAAAAVLAAVRHPAPGSGAPPRVFDLVGPEPVAFEAFLERTAAAARAQGRKASFQIREVSIEEADRAAAGGGFRGMGPDDVDVLLCDEVSDPTRLAQLLGRPLTPLDEAVAAAVGGTTAGTGRS